MSEQKINAKQEYEEAIMGVSAGQTGGGFHFLNTTICPSGADGVYRVETVNLETASHLHSYYCHIGQLPRNHVGHAAACEAFNALGFGHLEVDRTPWDGTGLGLCLQLRGRIAEGAILTRAEMEKLGYDLRVIFRVPDYRAGVLGVLDWAGACGAPSRDVDLVIGNLGATSILRDWQNETAQIGGEEVSVRDAEVIERTARRLNREAKQQVRMALLSEYIVRVALRVGQGGCAAAIPAEETDLYNKLCALPALILLLLFLLPALANAAPAKPVQHRPACEEVKPGVWARPTKHGWSTAPCETAITFRETSRVRVLTIHKATPTACEAWLPVGYLNADKLLGERLEFAEQRCIDDMHAAAERGGVR